MSIVTPSTFDISKLSISEIKKLEKAPTSIVYLNYNGGKLRIQTPQMPIPYDAGDFNGNKKYKVNLSFRDRAQAKKVAAYYELLETIDNFVLAHAAEKENAKKWFKLPGATRDMVGAFFTPSIRVSKDKDGNPKDYPPVHSVALKTTYGSGAFETTLYDEQKRRLESVTPLDVLRKGAEITGVVDCGGVWVGDKKFGITWKLTQARVDVPAQGTDLGCVIADEDEVDDEEIAAAPKSRAAAPAAPMHEEEEENEDGEDDEGEILEPVPVPVKAPVSVKKPVKKAGAKA
jgi:hypothetical protein